MNKEEVIQKMLLATAQHVALKYGYEFAPDCWDHLQGLVREGVNTIVAENRVDDEQYISLAEANIVVFATRMTIAAREQNLSELHEPTFHAAKQFLCPIWPFC